MKLFVYGFLPSTRLSEAKACLTHCVLSTELCIWQMLKNIASHISLNGMAAAPSLIPQASKSREGRQEVMDLSYLFHSQHVNDLVK